MSDLDLTASGARAERDALADRTDVIDKIGVLRCLPDDVHATTAMVSEFYEVDREALLKLVQRSRDELDDDGFRIVGRSEVVDILSMTPSELGMPRTAPSISLFPRRAVLRIGMLLRDSPVARQVRDHLLNVERTEMTEDEIVHRALHILDGKVKSLTTQVAELTAPARSWQLLADASGDFSVAEAAKILSRDPSITTGRDRLFDYMADKRWIFRSKNSRGGWEAYQTAVNTGRLVEKPAKPFLNSKTGAYELPAPTIRVTAKGIGKLHELMGGTEPIRFVVAEAS